MRKFPFSKKAINIMIATALLVTPLASLAPIGGNVTTVEASLSNETIVNLLELKSYYDGLTGPQVTIIDEHRALLGQLDSDWSTILGDLEGKISLASPKTATGMMTELAKIFIQSNYDAVISETEAFHTKYNTDFNSQFGISFTEFLGFYADLIANVKANYNQSTIEAAIGDSLTDFMVAEAKKVSSYGDLSADVKGAVGPEYDVASLIEIKFRMMTALSNLDDQNHVHGTLKDTLIAAVKQNLDTAPTGGGTTPPPPTTEPGEIDTTDSATETTETATDGSTTAVSTVDVAKLTESLQNASSVDKVTLTIENATGETAEARIPAAAVTAVSTKNPNAVVAIESSEGTIRVPVKEINIASIAQSLGVNAADVTINISIKTSTVVVKHQDGTESKSPVIEFQITATSGNSSMNLNNFNSYIERDITADGDLNVDRTTVVLLNADGSINKSVPAYVNGSIVTFRNRSNSLYTIIENDVTFPDITTNWAKATIEKLASKMVIEGMPSGNFEPRKAATRAEFAALLTRSLGLNKVDAYDNSFKDVNGSEWFVADMMAAVDAGIIEGHADGSFKGNDPVTREQAAAMIARAITLTGATVDLDSTIGLNDFADQANVSAWAASSVEQLIQAEIISGRPNAQIAPQGVTQRAEVSTMLERFLKLVNFMN